MVRGVTVIMATIQSQLEHLQAKYTGTGHADTTKHEWLTNQRRDAYASYIGHPALMSYFGVALNESKERVRCSFLKSMVQPCGPAPQQQQQQAGVANDDVDM